MSPRQISKMHAYVMPSHYQKVALDTHSRFLAAAAGFGGDKGGNLEAFYKRLAQVDDKPQLQERSVSLAELAAMGRKVIAEQAEQDDDARAERDAEDAVALDLFAKHREAAGRK